MQVVLMMIVVVVIFAVCWLPQNIYFLFTSYYPEFTTTAYVQDIYLGFFWLAMSNAMYNPIIYCWMNSRFVEVSSITLFFICEDWIVENSRFEYITKKELLLEI
jgi:hypothetical protein